LTYQSIAQSLIHSYIQSVTHSGTLSDDNSLTLLLVSESLWYTVTEPLNWSAGQ